jgi:hypothetical protein
MCRTDGTHQPILKSMAGKAAGLCCSGRPPAAHPVVVQPLRLPLQRYGARGGGGCAAPAGHHQTRAGALSLRRPRGGASSFRRPCAGSREEGQSKAGGD